MKAQSEVARAVPPPQSPTAPPQRVRVGSVIRNDNLIRKVDPVYPADIHVKGTVRLEVTVGRDGHVLQIKLISGHPLLVGAAMDAVKQWEYKPTLLNGSPVEVVTQVDLQFFPR